MGFRYNEIAHEIYCLGYHDLLLKTKHIRKHINIPILDIITLDLITVSIINVFYQNSVPFLVCIN